MKYYPEIKNDADEILRSLLVVKRVMGEDPGYLNSENCPYSEDVKQLIVSILPAPHTPDNTNEQTDDVAQEIDLEQEAIALYNDIRDFKDDLEDGSTSEKTQMFRVTVQLLEKLLSLREKSSGIRQYNQFKALVFTTLERYLTPAQINEVLEDLQDIEG